MQHQTMADGTVFLKASPGEEVVAALTEYLNDVKIFAGSFSAIGELREAEVGHFDPAAKAFRKALLRGPLEILSMTGNVSRAEDGRAHVHCHVVLGDRDMRASGGHLFLGVAEPTCELVLRCFNAAVVERRGDERYGLALWDLGERGL